MLPLNETFRLRDVGVSNALGNPAMPRHRWYSFKEAFSPLLVEDALRESSCGIGDVVLDPFCGSGTVPVTAATNGIMSIGFEVNPFFAFLSRCKLIQMPASALLDRVSQVRNACQVGADSPLEGVSTFSPRPDLEKWLFNRSVLRAFEGGWLETFGLEESARSLFQLALIGAAMDNCNASRDGKCLRYYRDWRNRAYDARSFLTSFDERIKMLSEDLSSVGSVGWGDTQVQVVEGDSRIALTERPFPKFRLAVTSPPYLNSFDYTDIYRPELLLGKFVDGSQGLRDLRLRTLRSHVQVDWPRPAADVDASPLLVECLNQIRSKSDLLWNQRIPLMIEAYFEDMREVFRALRDGAQDGASVWLVVSTSAYAGIEVPVDLILAHLATQVGWRLREVGVLRHLRTSGQHWERWDRTISEKPRLRESVVILDAGLRRRRKLKV